MTDRPRAVLDTNIFVAAALSRNSTSPNREVLDRWRRNEFVLIICTPLAKEIVEKLLERNIEISQVENLVAALVKLAEWVEVPEDKIEALLSDPDDNVIVACAVQGQANYLVTYDPHFETLGSVYKSIQIVKAIPFLEVLRKQNESA